MVDELRDQPIQVPVGVCDTPAHIEVPVPVLEQHRHNGPPCEIGENTLQIGSRHQTVTRTIEVCSASDLQLCTVEEAAIHPVHEFILLARAWPSAIESHLVQKRQWRTAASSAQIWLCPLAQS